MAKEKLPKESDKPADETPESKEIKKEDDKSSTRNIILIIIMIVGLLVLFFSIKYFYHPTPPEESYVYNGFKFTKVSSLWLTEVQVDNMIFRITTRYSPNELEHITVEPGVYKKIVGSKKIYFTLANNLSSVAVLGVTELGRIVGTRYGLFNIPSQAALTGSNDQGTPVKTCKDAVNGTGVIWFKLGNNTLAYSDGNCVIIQGADEWGIVKTADRVTFGLLGIMP